MKYLIVDTLNTFFRARHSAHRAADSEEKVAFALHVTMSSISKCFRDQKADHVVICLEGRSWRKDFYKPYKANRAVARAALSETEQEEDRMFWEAFDTLKTFFYEKSNCTVLQHPSLEADDLIAGWIQAHNDDTHVIVSSDSDFHQLLASNVKQYNGIQDELHTLEGILDKRGRLVLDKKTKEPKRIPEPAWILFEKCMRGDPSDNVFSAYPGVRTKGSKNKTGLEEAFADRGKRGFAWNNLMLSRWADHNGVEHKVIDDYERNVTLVDLTAQPTAIKEMIVKTITETERKNVSQIGSHFLKFCGKHGLTKLGENAGDYSRWLSATNELSQNN